MGWSDKWVAKIKRGEKKFEYRRMLCEGMVGAWCLVRSSRRVTVRAGYLTRRHKLKLKKVRRHVQEVVGAVMFGPASDAPNDDATVYDEEMGWTPGSNRQAFPIVQAMWFRQPFQLPAGNHNVLSIGMDMVRLNPAVHSPTAYTTALQHIDAHRNSIVIF